MNLAVVRELLKPTILRVQGGGGRPNIWDLWRQSVRPRSNILYLFRILFGVFYTAPFANYQERFYGQLSLPYLT